MNPLRNVSIGRQKTINERDFDPLSNIFEKIKNSEEK